MFSSLKSRFSPVRALGRRGGFPGASGRRRLSVEPLEQRMLLSVSSWQYTLDAEFDGVPLDSETTSLGVEHETVHDQLQLSSTTEILPFIWVPNNDGTVSRLHTETGNELGRYRVAPHSDSNPSRTTVDLDGSAWVGNRNGGTVVKIGHWEVGQWNDRNGDGIVQTSKDGNNDGKITGSEILPWGEDEAVLFEVVLIPGKEGTYVPGTYLGGYEQGNWATSPRGLAIDANNNLWAGTYSSKTFYYIDGSTGTISRSVDVSSVNHTSYGALIDGNGILWSSGQNKSHVLRLDPADDSFSAVNLGHFVYGLGIDYDNNLFVSGWQTGNLSKVDVLTGTVEWTQFKSELQNASVRGVTVTGDGHVWLASTADDAVYRYDNDGVLQATIPVGNGPTGVAVDAAGKVWVTNINDNTIQRIDPATNTVDLTKSIDGSGGHYGYSDMTGIVSWTITTQTGIWTAVTDSKDENTQWGTVSWTADVPAGSALTVEMTTSNDLENWADLQEVSHGVEFATPKARYLQVKVNFTAAGGGESPVLYDLTVSTSDTVNLPPIAAAGGPYVTDEGSAVTLDASGSSDPDGDPLRYRWDFDGDGWWDTFWSADPTFTYAWPDDYVGTAAVEVSDGREKVTDTAAVTVNNVAPQVTLDPLSPIYEGGRVTLTGAITDPGLFDTFTLDINWGDPLSPNNVEQYTFGASATGSQTISLEHQYLDDGPTPGGGTGSFQYPISVVLTEGLAPTTFDWTTVAPAAPVAATLDWDAASDVDGNAFWESMVNATNTRRWNFGASTSPVSVTDTTLLDLSKAYHFGADGSSGAGMASWQNLGFSGNPTGQDATFEILFRPEDLIDNHVLMETGGIGDGTVVKLEGDELVFRVQRFNPSGTADDNFVEIRTTLDTAGVFYHFVGTIDLGSDEASMYLNGQLIETRGTVLTDTLQPGGDLNDWAGGNAAGLSIASSSGGVAGGNVGWTTFNGDIAIVRYYQDNVFDAVDATANYNALLFDRATATVINVAPVIEGLLDFVAPDVIDEGSSVTLNARFTDPGMLDTHTAVVQWGDGTSETVATYPDYSEVSGTILAEYWTGIGGTAVSNLTDNPNYPHNPSGSEELTSFEGRTNWSSSYGTRVRGYVYPPVTGNYTFWIASDDNSELWLSNDDDPVNKRLIASVSGWTSSRQWDKYGSQQSAQIYLEAGQRYYIEALQKEGGGGDNLAVRWMLPGGTWEDPANPDEPIPGNRLSPIGALPTAHVTDTLSHTYADNGTYAVRLTVTDDDGGTGSSLLDPMAGVLAQWTFDDLNDPGYDDSGNGYSGELKNGPSWTDDSRSGGGLVFDGTDDYVSVPIDVSETGYAMAMWFKTDSDNRGLFAVVGNDLGAGGNDRHVYLSGGNLASRVWSNETIVPRA